MSQRHLKKIGGSITIVSIDRLTIVSIRFLSDSEFWCVGKNQTNRLLSAACKSLIFTSIDYCHIAVGPNIVCEWALHLGLEREEQ